MAIEKQILYSLDNNMIVNKVDETFKLFSKLLLLIIHIKIHFMTFVCIFFLYVFVLYENIEKIYVFIKFYKFDRS
jgi:hypothetical protein